LIFKLLLRKTFMTVAYLHLILNHIPVFGVLASIPILLYGLFKHQYLAQKIALCFILASAVIIIPVYLTGDQAEHEVEKYAGVSKVLLESHESWGKWSLWSTLALGILASFTLVRINQNPEFSGKLMTGVLILTFVVAGVQGKTAIDGGKIRRPELRINQKDLPDNIKDSWLMQPGQEEVKEEGKETEAPVEN